MTRRTTPVVWIVTKPTAHSELIDICFACDTWTDLEHQFKGGLRGDDIYGWYHHEQQARNVAQSLLDVRDGKLSADMVTQ